MALLKRTRDFTTIPNGILNHPKMTFKAKGLWAFLESKPHGWNFSAERICKQTKDGKDAVKSGLQELEKYGYLARTMAKSTEGEFAGYDYHLFDEPAARPVKTPVDGKPVDGKPVDGKTVDGKPADISNKENSKTELSKTEREPQPPVAAKPQKKEPEKDLFGEKPNPNKKTLFENSAYFEMPIFKEKLKEAAELGVDVEYYHRQINNWSLQKNQKRTGRGWIATARTWMERDKDGNKLRMIKTERQEQNEDAEMREYLNI